MQYEGAVGLSIDLQTIESFTQLEFNPKLEKIWVIYPGEKRYMLQIPLFSPLYNDGHFEKSKRIPFLLKVKHAASTYHQYSAKKLHGNTRSLKELILISFPLQPF